MVFVEVRVVAVFPGPQGPAGILGTQGNPGKNGKIILTIGGKTQTEVGSAQFQTGQ